MGRSRSTSKTRRRLLLGASQAKGKQLGRGLFITRKDRFPKTDNRRTTLSSN
jgi:hypothetical protein